MKDKAVGKVRVIGSQADIDKAWEVLPDALPLGEAEARMIIQDIIDVHKLKATILYGGNTVWSFDRLIRDFKKVLKANSTANMTKYLYQFFSLKCGTIAHYSLSGWSSEYPDNVSLRRLFLKNEFGGRVSRHIPQWHTDARRIAIQMDALLGI